MIRRNLLLVASAFLAVVGFALSLPAVISSAVGCSGCTGGAQSSTCQYPNVNPCAVYAGYCIQNFAPDPDCYPNTVYAYANVTLMNNDSFYYCMYDSNPGDSCSLTVKQQCGTARGWKGPGCGNGEDLGTTPMNSCSAQGSPCPPM